MTVANTLYVLILCYVFLFSITIIVSKKAISRVIGAIHIVLFMIVIAYLSSALTGYPRNVGNIKQTYYFFEPSKFVILDFMLEPDKNIYIWVLNHKNIPMSFRLDWDDDLAEALHEAQQQSSQTGSKIEIDFTGDDNQSNSQDEDKGETKNSLPSVQINQIDFFLKN